MPSYQETKRRGNYTAAEKAAYNAGRGYALAKAGKRVPTTAKTKDSFLAGHDSVSCRNCGKKKKK